MTEIKNKYLTIGNDDAPLKLETFKNPRLSPMHYLNIEI